MKVITQPVVTVVAKQVFLGHPAYDIPDDGCDAVKIGAFAAKGCYDSFGAEGRANEANQRQIIEHEHGSVLEHITFTLFVEGITRALSLESNRHRSNAVSQRSTRYTAEEDAAIVLEPYYAELFGKYGMVFIVESEDNRLGRWYPSINVPLNDSTTLGESILIRNFLNDCNTSIVSYQQQVEILINLNPLKLTGFDLRKWARGKARNVLPHALETRITYTGNVRAWRWFIESRSDKHAEPEIRRLANLILGVLRIEAPLYFEDFLCKEIYDAIPVWTPTYSKV